jgi:hypothetical protein
MAYEQARPPRGTFPGQIIRSRLSLGVDPFFYFDELARDGRYPALVYTWDVRGIRRETAPHVRRNDVWVRDESKRARIQVPRSNAWEDDGGNGDYLLDCDLPAAPAKRDSSTAT